MRLSQVSLFVALVLCIAGCAAVAPSKPTDPRPVNISGPSEFLYLGTSAPGLLKYGIFGNGSLQASAADISIPTVCSAELSLARGGNIFSLSNVCLFSPSETEFRRFVLGVQGHIDAATPPLSLPGLPSASGFVLRFITGMNGKFGYAWSIAADGTQHITPVLISQSGDLTVMPDLGISWPVLDPIASGCSADHMPDAVVQTVTGPYLSVRHQITCAEQDGSAIVYSLYKLDQQTGAIGILLGGPAIDSAPESAFVTYNGSLLLSGETHHQPGFETGKLALFRVDPAGSTFLNDPTTTVFLQACLPDQSACAHPDAGTFHPSGKWLFIADRQAGGIWTVPVSDSSISPEKASFLAVSLLGGERFAFSSTGRFLYIAQWNGTFAEIQGFQVDETTGALTTLAGSPWSLGRIASVTSIINVSGSDLN